MMTLDFTGVVKGSILLIYVLLIFYRVKLSTVSLIKHSLDQFQFLSGFSPNYDKSNMFPYGVEHNTKTQLLDVLGYKKGSC
jgi:hypothetical protein